MINFKMNIKDSNKYLYNLIWLFCKTYIVIAIVLFLLSVFFILVGFLDDKEALMYGIGLIMIDIILVLIVIRVALYCKNNLAYMFKFVNNNGELEYTLNKDDSQYVLENLTRKTIVRINFDNIKTIVKTKRLILIKVKIGNAIFLPNTDELISFLSLNCNN